MALYGTISKQAFPPHHDNLSVVGSQGIPQMARCEITLVCTLYTHIYLEKTITSHNNESWLPALPAWQSPRGNPRVSLPQGHLLCTLYQTQTVSRFCCQLKPHHIHRLVLVEGMLVPLYLQTHTMLNFILVL